MLSFSCSTERSLDLFTEVNTCLDTLGLKRDKLAGVTTDGCLNLTGENVGLLNRMQDKVTEVDPKQKLIFFEGFYEKVAASLEPKRGQHSPPLANTEGNTFSQSPPHVLIHVGSTSL